jgi:hypothetical protein
LPEWWKVGADQRQGLWVYPRFPDRQIGWQTAFEPLSSKASLKPIDLRGA